HLLELLHGGHAHLSFDDAVRDLPADLRGKAPRGSPYTAWQLVEHLRLAQDDILRFSRNTDGSYEELEWPDDYWPKARAPRDDAEWEASLAAFRADRKAMEGLVADPAQDLFAPFPWGDGQTLLREAMLVADHTAYHLGQLVLLRRLIGAWRG
ncbi:MAG TPA: DinB family protein, partial [Gemmatimonadales bacterium]|nr:DinB family protein [Gemmatimonadales bacterium]